jgi:hypothetical protein
VTTGSDGSQFRVAKGRAEAVVTLSSGQSLAGCFFVAGGSARHAGREDVGDVLNAEDGFVPFEVQGDGTPHTVLLRRNHMVTVALAENEASRDPGYAVARRRTVSLLLSNDTRLAGTVRVYRPEGRDRLSDWAAHGERFRYVETREATLLVNVEHVVEASEVEEP